MKLVLVQMAEDLNVGEASRVSKDWLVARRTIRSVLPSGVLWGVVFGVFVASSAFSYSSVYKTQAERASLASAFGANVSTSALFGPGLKLDTVAGYTAFHIWLTTAIIGAVWGITASTKALRGEEDSGRWELMLTGRTTQMRATFQALSGLLGGVFAAWLLTAAITAGSGRAQQFGVALRPALFFALALVATALMFMAVGALTSQLGATRRQAATYAGWVLGASYALRMIADSGTGVHWLVWVSPLGWVEELKPLTYSDALPLVAIFLFTLAVGSAAVVLAGNRDVGAALIQDRPHARARLRLLGGHFGLAIRLVRPVLVNWGIAVAITGFLLGYISYAAGETLSRSSMYSIYSRLGASGTGIEVFLGVSFLVAAVVLTFVAIGQLTATRAEEAEGRLDQLFSRPVGRTWWLFGRLSIAVVVLVFFGVLSGVTAWLGVAVGTTKVSFVSLLEAGLNIVPPSIFILGAATLAMGVWPRATATVGYSLLSWSLLIEFIGGIGAMNKWLFDTSLFHQMAAAPSVPPNLTSDLWMTAIGIAAAALGLVAFARRDLQGR